MDEFLLRAFDQILGRTSGPLHSRFVLQPLMAIILGTRAGYRDAKFHRPPFLWAMVMIRAERRALLLSAWKDVGRVFAVALVVDVAYQLAVFGWLYPLQTLIIAVSLAIIPYVLVRGPVVRMITARSVRALVP